MVENLKVGLTTKSLLDFIEAGLTELLDDESFLQLLIKINIKPTTIKKGTILFMAFFIKKYKSKTILIPIIINWYYSVVIFVSFKKHVLYWAKLFKPVTFLLLLYIL